MKKKRKIEKKREKDGRGGYEKEREINKTQQKI